MTSTMKTVLLVLLLVLLLSVAAFGQMRVQTVTIASGASASSALKPMGGCIPTFILMPGTWTAASLTPEVSTDGVTYTGVYDEYGSQVLIAAAASRVIRLSPADYLAFPYLRFSSVNSSGVAANQAGARSLVVGCKTN